MPFHHRASSLKQSNKKHKAKSHLASKRSIKVKFGGKVNVTAPGDATARPTNKQKTTERDLKQDRLNRAKQMKEQKRNELFLQRRIGSTNGPRCRVVALVGLSMFSDTQAVLQNILQAADSHAPSPLGNAVSACFAASKQRFTFITPAFSAMDVSEAAKIADLVIFVLNVAHGEEGCITPEGDLIISVLRSQGYPGAAGIIQGLKDLTAKQQGDMRRYGNRFFATEFGDKVKVAEADNQVQVVRALTTASSQMLHWRTLRACVMADQATWEAQQHDPTLATLKLTGYIRGKPLSVNQLVHLTGIGTFQMATITKGSGEPCPFKTGASAREGVSMEQGEGAGEGEVLAVADVGRQEGLEMMAEPDDMEGEQTWPSEEELAEAAKNAKGEAVRRKQLVKKMGDYQASWFLDMDDDDLEDYESDQDDEGDEQHKESKAGGAAATKTKGAASSSAAAAPVEGVRVEGADGEEHQEEDDEDEDDDEDDTMTVGDLASMATGSSKPKTKREMRSKEEGELEFPDEIDTPEDVPARQRFARYRALKSFRTSPWDPKESLPREYSRIFSFQSFQRAQARVMAELEEVENQQNKALLEGMRPSRSRRPSTVSGPSSSNMDMDVDVDVDGEMDDSAAHEDQATDVHMQEEEEEEGEEEERDRKGRELAEGFVASGTYVTLTIPNVPLAALQERCQRAPLLAYSLLRYENKVSVLHFNIQRHPTFEGPLASKERLIFSTGFRSFEARPVFSENNLNCDKHKFSRFLHPGRFTTASVYGPVTMMPCPLLVYKQTVDETTGVVIRTDLVATGSLGSVGPDRIVLKKIVLSGFPVRVKKRGGVVKHMFYNPDDVRWFRPAELFTKQGAVGHIKEPVGTHGLMKVRFNKVIKQSDTVCLALYKRVYPKFLDEAQPQVVCR